LLGSFGKLLIIDLSKSDIIEKELEEDIYKQYLGGKGLGTYLLLKMLPPGVDPFSPQNVLIFTTGPATDTVLAPASRFGLFGKSPATGLYSESFSGGYLPPLIKRTGYDAIIVIGAAERPCFISISEIGVNFYDAEGIWGLETYAAEEALLNAVGVSGAGALVIGPAGERRLNFATTTNGGWRTAGPTGFGAVMGSKNLKGIIFSGSAKAFLADEKGLAKWNRDFARRYKGSPVTDYTSQKGVAVFSAAADYLGDQLALKSIGCYHCFLACEKTAVVTKGCHKGLTTQVPDYETFHALGELCHLSQIADILYLKDLCNRWGVDPVSAGWLAAFAIEAGHRGKLLNAPKHGDADSIALFLQLVVEGKGEGVIFGEGLKVAACALGMEDCGTCEAALKSNHMDFTAYHENGILCEAGINDLAGERQIEGRARMVIDIENLLNIYGCLIMCPQYRHLIHWKELIAVLYMITGKRFSAAELHLIAGRVQAATRIFNLREGAPMADQALSHNLLNEALSEYYILHGWDEKGVPPLTSC
jgi:aldehyde:ferredoxin oxidoreductase